MSYPVGGIVSAAAPVGAIGRVSGATAGGGREFEKVLAERVSRPPARAGAVVQRVLDQMQANDQALDEIIAAASRGRRFSPQELLVLQARIYRFGEQVALATKTAEQAAGELKRLWQMQV